MDLDVDGPPIGAEYATAIESGLSTMGVDDIEVLYTDDFVSTIQTLTGNSSYGAERGNSGTVAAKTLRPSTGVVAIVANRTILEGYGPEATERVLAHEAGHVHTMNRAEDLGWHDTLELETDYWARMVLAMGMHAADEFRCEAAVYEAGYGSEYGSSDAGVAQSLYEYTAHSLKPLYEPGLAPDDIRRQHIVQLLDLIQKDVANLAARHLHGQPFDVSSLGEHSAGNWYDLLGGYWQNALEMYAGVPDARTPWPREAALTQAAQTKELGTTLLTSLGYGWAAHEALVVTLSQDAVTSRVERFQAESADIPDDGESIL